MAKAKTRPADPPAYWGPNLEREIVRLETDTRTLSKIGRQRLVALRTERKARIQDGTWVG